MNKDVQSRCSPPERIPIIVLIGVAVVIAATIHSGTDLAVWTALLLRPIMHGVSLFKIDFLLLFFCAVGALTIGGPTIRNCRTLKVVMWLTILAMVVGGLVGMGAYLSLASDLHLPLSKYAYFFSNGYNSINQYAHLHVTKTGLYYLLSWLGLRGVTAYADAGVPFVGHVNPGMSLTVLATAGTCLIAFLSCAATVVRSWSGYRQVIVLCLYSLSGAHCIKCLVDGGMLTYDFLPSAITVCLLLLHARGHELWTVLAKSWVKVVLITLLFLALVSIFSLQTALVVQPQQYAFFFAVYFLLALPLKRDISVRLTLIIPAAAALFWFGLYYYAHTVRDITALTETISREDRISVHDMTSVTPASRSLAVASLGDSAIGERAIDVYRREAQNPLRNRTVMIQKGSESRYTGFIFALRILKADSTITFDAAPHLKIRGAEMSGETLDSLMVFRIDLDSAVFPSLWNEPSDIVDENNRFAALYYIDSYFAARGLSEYVLIPLYYEDIACRKPIS